MAVDHRLMGEITGQGGFADAIRADQHGVGRVLEEVEGHQRFEGCPVDGGGPVPVEVAQGFEATDMCALKATLEATAGPFFLLPFDQRFWPSRRWRLPANAPADRAKALSR